MSRRHVANFDATQRPIFFRSLIHASIALAKILRPIPFPGENESFAQCIQAKHGAGAGIGDLDLPSWFKSVANCGHVMVRIPFTRQSISPNEEL
jgi:hypothetical protein